MKQSTVTFGLVMFLSVSIVLEPVWARGFGGGGRIGGGGGGFHGGGGGGGFHAGGGGFSGGGGFHGGGGGFQGGGGLSGGGFHPSTPHPQMNHPSGNFGGGNLGGGNLSGRTLGGGAGAGNRPFVVHQPNSGIHGLTPGGRPPIQPGGGFAERFGGGGVRPGGEGRPGLPANSGIRPGNLSGATERFPGINRPGAGGGTASLPGLGPSRPGAGGSGERNPGIRPGQGGAGERFPGTGTRPGQGGAGERLPGTGTRPGQGGSGERWSPADHGTVPERHQDLENRFNDLNNHWNDSNWHHQQWTGPNGGEINHFGYWGPNGYWGHTGAWGPNGGYMGHSGHVGPNGAWGHTGYVGPNGAWGHTGYFGPSGHWSRNWGWYNGYAPAWGNGRWNYLWDTYPAAMAFGATMWGLNAVSYAFGVGSYTNPYYVAGSSPVSYAQPIIGDASYDDPSSAQVADTQATDPNNQAAAASPPPDPLTQAFDAARQAFFDGKFDEALNLTNQALKQAPQDAAMNEFRSLCLFALGQYQDAAATIHAVLAAGPGWDWTTMISLYSSPEVYTGQLRKLESAEKANPQAADLRFLLAYHYLTCDQQTYALRMWKEVIKLQPNDRLSAQLIKMYEPPDESTPPTQKAAPPNLDKPGFPLEKLQGKWVAKSDGGTFTLSLNADEQFQWEFNRDGKPQSVSGVYAVRGTNLVMQPDSGGTMLADINLKDDHTLAFDPIGDANKLVFTK